MIVVDASALAKYLLKEPGWRSVAGHLEADRAATLDHALKEVLNAVWKTARLRGLLSMEHAEEKREALNRLVEGGVVEVEGEAKYLGEAFRISFETGLTVYDSLYIAQALKHGARLLTADAMQAEAARKLGVKVVLV